MTNLDTVVVAGLILAAGTYLLRVGGPSVRRLAPTSEAVEETVDASAAVLLLAVAVTAALTEGQHLAGVARPAGVAVGAVLALRGAPLLLVALAAAGTAAALRLAGLP